VGEIEFFGGKGIDLDAVRTALPLREGGPPPKPAAKQKVRDEVRRAAGSDPTDVAFVCCDRSGDWMIYIGLPGASSRRFAYNPEPKGAARLPSRLLKLYEEMDSLLFKAVQTGDTGEDDSQGYALSKNPRLRGRELEMRKYALDHEPLVRTVLETSSDPLHRRVAAQVLGYGRQWPGQINDLVRASRDPDDEVRNNAIRALGVLARSSPRLSAQIPVEPFIDMLSSGTWTDRNKGAALMEILTTGRDPKLLANVRAHAMDALIEMAEWRAPGHAFFARMILGRIAGIEEDRLHALVDRGAVGEIVAWLSEAVDSR
jgi:hypothetical protein